MTEIATLRVGEEDLPLVHDFGTGRAIVDGGALFFVDRIGPGAWELSGEPARPGLELETLNALMKSRLGARVIVTAPDGTKTTFEDPS